MPIKIKARSEKRSVNAKPGTIRRPALLHLVRVRVRVRVSLG